MAQTQQEWSVRRQGETRRSNRTTAPGEHREEREPRRWKSQGRPVDAKESVKEKIEPRSVEGISYPASSFR
ncbi:hypothetical protein D5086_014156 [Populus alba]|uniref:Uncharacterized protein n=1 Tax=Populus alba TaxID=43335 RepID=A0ACC4C716_POPAL